MKALLFTLALVLALVAIGCKNDNPEPDLPDARRVDAPGADSPGDAPASCFDETGTPANCFVQTTCEPTQLADFLNGCTDSSCIHFDNAARLPLYNNGNLPAIP